MPDLLRLLRQPYPRTESRGRHLLTALLVGVFVFVFLWFFEPFGLAAWHHPHKVWYLAGYGVVTVAVLALLAVVELHLFPCFFSERTWTLGKAIGWTLCVLVGITLGNWLYNAATGMGSFRWQSFGQTLLATFSVGVFPSILVPLANYAYSLRRYAVPPDARQGAFADDLPQGTRPAGAEPARLDLVAENGRDRLSVPLPDLLFIESSDNYATVYSLRDGRVVKELLRSSLNRLETQLPASALVRCHRSYIVNLSRVRAVSGNAQGYKLHLDGCETPVPVARKHSGLVKDRLAT